jgi:heavy metal sensor kinase
MNTRSLSFRLVTWYAGVLTLVFIVLGALTLLFLRHYLEAGVLDTQVRRARQIADTLLTTTDQAGEARLARQVEDLYSPEVNDRFIRITRNTDDSSATGARVIYASGAPHDGSFSPATIPIPARAEWSGQREELVRKEILPAGSVLIAAVAQRGGPAGHYLVEVGISTLRTDATLGQVLLLLAVGLPIAVCIAVSGGFVLVRRALKPVDEIARKAEEISQLHLSRRLPLLNTGDELERLSVSLNHMISRLEDAVQSSKRFVADASHELRTPLTVLRGELESLAQDIELRADTRESLGSLLEEVDRLTEIVESLLALSKLDAGEAIAENVRFDLGELVETTAEQMSLLAEDKEIAVACNATPSVMIEGDRARMKQVVVNLLDNAIKYTPRGGRVSLRIAREADHAVLEVTDTGVGIPAEALPHMFKRFFRVDDSRSREQGGAGLGLSIVKSICAAQGAEVNVTSTPGGGSCFRVRHPLAGAVYARSIPSG